MVFGMARGKLRQLVRYTLRFTKWIFVASHERRPREKLVSGRWPSCGKRTHNCVREKFYAADILHLRLIFFDSNLPRGLVTPPREIGSQLPVSTN